MKKSKENSQKKFPFCKSVAWLPVLNTVFILTALIVPFAISYTWNISKETLPYISDFGTIAPASCWFALLLGEGFQSIFNALMLKTT